MQSSLTDQLDWLKQEARKHTELTKEHGKYIDTFLRSVAHFGAAQREYFELMGLCPVKIESSGLARNN